ncbi:glutathione S-transferase family protein [Rhodanobacter sp. C03]|uniref:glutathione S-transferase family protein n=1 Tax=Rhodanobacter sp. C03 TaxID=1945858 RepID=UPI00098681F4|nr:glutathione S-transferase family protein [Rhodanobacter sp. C03]OOG56191.1 glutathione S-transferase [Rhodanobacter sp. C03]
MKIYWIKAQAPRRVLALVKHLGIKAEFVEVDLMAGGLKTPDYAALNPNMKAPMLIDGDLVLWESGAIMAHLCIKTGSDMWPAHNPAEQVELLRWLSWNDCHWSTAVAPFYFEHVVKTTFGIGQPDSALLKASVPDFVRYAKVLDGHLADRRFIACERLTIADFALASMAAYWRESEMPLEAFPHIFRWLDALARIPAWADPWPANHCP